MDLQNELEAIFGSDLVKARVHGNAEEQNVSCIVQTLNDDHVKRIRNESWEIMLINARLDARLQVFLRRGVYDQFDLVHKLESVESNDGFARIACESMPVNLAQLEEFEEGVTNKERHVTCKNCRMYMRTENNGS